MPVHKGLFLWLFVHRLVSCTLLGWLEATLQLTGVLERGLLPGEDSMGTPVAVSSSGR